MMTETREGHETFQEFLWSQYGLVGISDPLQKLRAKAWDQFLTLGLPTKKNDVYRYIRLRSLFANHYEPAKSAAVESSALASYILPECRGSVLVFINGSFVPSLSHVEGLSKHLVILPLPEAMRTYGGFLNNQWSKSLKEESDPFALLNAALHSGGLFLYLTPRSAMEVPIQILNVIDAGDTAMYIIPRLQVFVGAQSELNLVSTQAVLSGEKYTCNAAADIAIEEESHVCYTQCAVGLKPSVWHFDALRSVLKRNATLKTINVSDGAATVRFDYRVALAGENSEALLNGVWMLKDKREVHTHAIVDHQAPYCRSLQLFKGALNDAAHSSFEGKILVRQAAQKTEAYQLNNNLLLSDTARADSKPNLEIFADDVKASHGSTVGQLDTEQIFYMKTRGFSEEEAKNLLVYGFCKEIVDKVPVPSLHEDLQRYAQGYLSHG